ncbi:tight adherence protein C [Melghirimyces thermohalophilus]|uniref:Tight adherence protein C n=1 Tax=Melghirimyces thermohalophilus TaxID=1236220 RepID=A0A1G6RWJ6_9BACL|nr:type II secretion system F family protein [Melghirimyces thermohalophilus]SDD08803.1 tight adherence protein C [Melghirimyces thermohalophilus]
MSTIFLYFFVFMAWCCLLVAGLNYLSYRKEQETVHGNLLQRINPWKFTKKEYSRVEILHKWLDNLAPIGHKIEILSDPEELEDHLVKAGHPYGMTVDRLQGAKIIGALIGLICGIMYYILGLPFAVILCVFSPFLGYMAPITVIRMMAKRRQEQIRYELPDFLDMMSITLQAGMGMDDALHYYVSTNKGPLSEEFARLNQEISFGVQRETAYRAFMKRITSTELEALIQSLIQAHNLGTPVAQTFAQQAEEMRRMRSEQAKEAAGKAAPKISLVSGLIIAPSIMLLILGSIVYSYFIARDIFGGM